MPMLESRTNRAITFNPDFFDHSTVDRLLALRPPKIRKVAPTVRLSPVFKLAAFKRRDAQALFDADATQAALDQALAILMEDPDYRSAIDKGGKAPLITKASNRLAKQLTTASINATVSAKNRAARESLKLVANQRGILTLKVGRTRLLAVDTRLAGSDSFALIMQIATVVLDVVALISTAIGIAIEKGTTWVKRIAEFIRGMGQSIVDWAGKLLSSAGNWISKLIEARFGPNVLKVVKAYANEIASFVAHWLKGGFGDENVIKAFRYALACLFVGPWYKKAYYALQLMGSILLFIGSGGAAILVKVVLAVVQLSILIWDTIDLIGLLQPKKVIAP